MQFSKGPKDIGDERESISSESLLEGLRELNCVRLGNVVSRSGVGVRLQIKQMVLEKP